jgi:hypothetical protein
MLKEEGILRDLNIDVMIVLKLCYRELCEGVGWISVTYDFKFSRRVSVQKSREISILNAELRTNVSEISLVFISPIYVANLNKNLHIFRVYEYLRKGKLSKLGEYSSPRHGKYICFCMNSNIAPLDVRYNTYIAKAAFYCPLLPVNISRSTPVVV